MKRDSGDFQAVGNSIFSLYNLGCSSCSGILERKLKKVSGIAEVNVNYVTDIVQVKFDPGKVTSDEIRALMKKLGHDTAVRR
jgi:copper chaperone CopZ